MPSAFTEHKFFSSLAHNSSKNKVQVFFKSIYCFWYFNFNVKNSSLKLKSQKSPSFSRPTGFSGSNSSQLPKRSKIPMMRLCIKWSPNPAASKLAGPLSVNSWKNITATRNLNCNATSIVRSNYVNDFKNSSWTQIKVKTLYLHSAFLLLMVNPPNGGHIGNNLKLCMQYLFKSLVVPEWPTPCGTNTSSST